MKKMYVDAEEISKDWASSKPMAYKMIKSTWWWTKKIYKAYQKSYDKLDISLKQFPYLKDTVLEGLKKN